MESSYLVDNLGLVTELKETAMLVMVSKREKQIFKKAAAKDERPLSDWIRFLARARARELGLEVDVSTPEPRVRKKKKDDE